MKILLPSILAAPVFLWVYPTFYSFMSQASFSKGIDLFSILLGTVTLTGILFAWVFLFNTLGI